MLLLEEVSLSWHELNLQCDVVKAASAKTPQPTPVSLPSSHDSPPCSKNRVSRLRKMCLKRDRHRCVISRKFDKVEGGKRLREDSNSKDDDGRFLGNEPYANFAILEVAHIIPHSIMTADSASELVCIYRESMWLILSNSKFSVSRKKLRCVF